MNISDALFYNDFTSSLPGDSSGDKTPRFTPKVCFSFTEPTAAPKPALILTSENLKNQFLWQIEDTLKVRELLSGGFVPESAKPFSLCYGGHQFGNWAGQLGDGRAITLGELKDRDGKSWELQLKGAGLTPYSRTADGRAVFRSSLREFLASEAMFHLGVPTTRALSLATTGQPVLRDMFYTGDVKPEPGAVVARMAPSFLRFGNFEILAAQGEIEIMKDLLNWVIDRHHPEIRESDELKRYGEWFKVLCERTAFMITEWLRVGFVHGVMNTDNMSLLGLTIDYGPYGWLEEYDPSWTPNTTDLPGRRYCFGRQATVAHWNIQALASSLNVIPDFEPYLQDGIDHYQECFEKYFIGMMNRKLGLHGLTLAKDQEFLRSTERLLKDLHVDMTLFYRRLANWHPELNPSDLKTTQKRLTDTMYVALTPELEKIWKDWLEAYGQKIREDGKDFEERRKQMNLVNPKYVLRNSMALRAIEAFQNEGDPTVIKELYEVLKDPYSEQPQFENWASMRPESAVDLPGSSTLSCSS